MQDSPTAPQSAASPPRPRLERIFAYRWMLVLAAAVIMLDRISKAWICARLPYQTYGFPGHIVVIDDFFNLVNVGNTGAAWSLFAGRNTALTCLDVAALIAIFVWRRQLGLRSLVVQISFGLLCGGIVGNFLDRLLYGHVIDFLDFHFGSYIYPTFNVADSGICVGVGIYLLYSLFLTEPSRK
jgi:signal peptidase II